MATQGAEYYYLDISIFDEPRVISEIETDQVTSRCVSCLNDEEIWTCSDTSMRLYNLKGELLKAIKTKSEGVPMHLRVTEITMIELWIRWRTRRYIQWSDLGIGYLEMSVLHPLATFLVFMNSNGKNSKFVSYTGSVEKQSIQYGDSKKPLFHLMVTIDI